MARKATSGYSFLILMVLAVALVTACGGGGGAERIASMSQGRWNHTATLLEDGRVLVVGGQETRAVDLAVAEIYDPSTGTWSSAGAMKETRGEGHTATLLKDGRVLVVGDGYSTEVYDPSTGIWTFTGSMSEVRTWHTATLLEDGRVLVAGGMAGRLASDTAEVYDPSTGEWSSAGTLSAKQDHHVAALLPDGKVLLVGRFAVNIYDPSTGTWSIVENKLPERYYGFTATVLADGKVVITGGSYFTGGYSGFYKARMEVDTYDPATGTWTTTTPMKTARKSHPATILEDGKMLVIASSAAEVYDPATDTWTSAGEMKYSRIEGHTATLLGDGTVLVVGGRKDTERTVAGAYEGGTARTEVEIYDPSTGW